jgi:dipeptidyl aminopeptidase/acylaminoacyl peptidase
MKFASIPRGPGDWLLMIGLAAAIPPVAAADVDALVDLFFQPPEITNLSLSPDGTTIAYQDYVKGARTLCTVDAATLKRVGYIGGPEGEGKEISWYEWADKDRLLYRLAKWNKYASDLISTDKTLTNRIGLAPDKDIFLMDSTPYVANTALVQDYGGDVRHYDVQELDIASGRHWLTNVAHNPGDFVAWAVDLNGRVCVGYKERADGYTDLYYRADQAGAWKQLPIPDRGEVVGFTAKGTAVMLRFPDPQTHRFVVQFFDLERQELTGPRISDPGYDVAATDLRDTITHEIVGLYYQSDHPVFVWFDPQYERLHDEIKHALPALQHWIEGRTASGEVVVSSWSDVQPDIKWMFDPKTAKARTLRRSRPAVKAAEMSRMEAVTFPGRDGVSLHGFLSRPPGKTGALPLLLDIHGGPYARDVWGFDSEVQFFAALGYAVLQVNYRGSTGLGDAYELPTILDVLKISIDDIADAVKWATETGVADPARVGIYGASYGGYAAVASAARYPQLYRCALGFAGVYDWEAQMRDAARGGGTYFRWKKDKWANAATAPEKFRPFSPVHEANAIQCPVWLGHGGADWIVSIEQTKMMTAALKKAGKKVELQTDAWGVHGLPDVEKRRKYYRAVAAFLEKNLSANP